MINGVLFQGFHWFLPDDGNHWTWLSQQISALAQKGITSIWLPPLSKGMGNTNTVGYDIWDLWDLGYYQKTGQSERRTKYGNYEQLLKLINTCKNNNIEVYADLVFNHKMGGELENVRIQKVADDDKNTPLESWKNEDIYTNFHFQNRFHEQINNPQAPTDNQFVWFYDHFDAYICDKGVYRIKDKNFQCQSEYHSGNHPYLMGADVDTSHPDVYKELLGFCKWLVNKVGVSGFRIDAIKHIRQSFFPKLLTDLRNDTKKEIFAVGEYMEEDSIDLLNNFIYNTERKLSLFDFRLRANFWYAADWGAKYSLKHIFDNTLVASNPHNAVTFVDNHDLQICRGHAKEFRLVEHDWFKPLAYALILLRPAGYPCVFFGDYYPSDLQQNGNLLPRHQWIIDKFLEARKVAVGNYLYDYFDHDNCIAWVSKGETKTIAVIMSNGSDGTKYMNTQKPNTTFIDITNQIKIQIKTDNAGNANFRCAAGKVSVWIEQ